jgi:hypothetical protein
MQAATSYAPWGKRLRESLTAKICDLGKRDIALSCQWLVVVDPVTLPRTARAAVAGMIDHALNRGNWRETEFHKPADCDARGNRCQGFLLTL